MAKIYVKQFTKEPYAKKIWDKLAEKYNQEDTKNYIWLDTQFDNLKFVNTKPIKFQLQEYINLRAQLEEESMIVSECFFVVKILNRLPPS